MGLLKRLVTTLGVIDEYPTFAGKVQDNFDALEPRLFNKDVISGEDDTGEQVLKQVVITAAELEDASYLEVKAQVGRDDDTDDMTFRIRIGAAGDLTDAVVVEVLMDSTNNLAGLAAALRWESAAAVRLLGNGAGGWDNIPVLASAVPPDLAVDLSPGPLYITITGEKEADAGAGVPMAMDLIAILHP